MDLESPDILIGAPFLVVLAVIIVRIIVGLHRDYQQRAEQPIIETTVSIINLGEETLSVAEADSIVEEDERAPSTHNIR